MPTFAYSGEQEDIRKMVRSFVDNEVAPGAFERDQKAEFPYAAYRKLGELGVMGMRFPEKYGGTERDFLTWCLAVEEIGRVDLGLSWTLFVTVNSAQRLVRLATSEQQRLWEDRWIRPLARGEVTAGAAIAEPDAGSDTSRLKTTAVLDRNGWVINGQKAYATNAGLENNAFVLVTALTNPEKKEFSIIIVPTGTPGYSIMPKYVKMGMRSSDTRALAFADCRVPELNAIGGQGEGRQFMLEQAAVEARLQLASSVLGLAIGCYDEAIAYAKQRVAFKKPISQFQFVQEMLVQMALEVELSRCLRDKAAVTVDEGRPSRKLSSMAKYFCAEAARRAADNAVQIFGGMGVMEETAVNRYYRDVRASTIGLDATSEIQKWSIARELGC